MPKRRSSREAANTPTPEPENGVVLPVDDPKPGPLTPDLLEEIEDDPLLLGVAVVARRYVETGPDQ
jgi:hypothetical protein